MCKDVISVNDAIVRGKKNVPRCWEPQLYCSVLSEPYFQHEAQRSRENNGTSGLF